MTAELRTCGRTADPAGAPVDPVLPVPLTADGIAAVTKAAGRLAGLPTEDAELVKFTNNAVVRLPRARAVLRIAGSHDVGAKLPVVVAAARWLETLGLPAVRLLPGVPQPLHAAGHLLTVWRDVELGDVPASAGGLAAILRWWHAIDVPPPAEVRAWNLPAFVRRRIDEADRTRSAGDPAGGAVADRDLRFLRDELARVEELVAGLGDIEPLVPPGVLHGDAFLGNLVASPAGPVICDFDHVAIGPREWDLVPVAVGALRFDYAAGLQEAFVRTYGVDVTRWPGFAALRALRELQLVTSVLPTLEANPALRAQWRLRLDSLRRRDTVRWTPYSDAAVSR